MTIAPASELNILLVDDSELVRRGIRAVLEAETEPAMKVVAEAGTVTEAVTEALRVKPDIVLLDIRLPGGTGFDACREILRHLPETRVVMLTSYSNDNYVYEAVTAGAHGYLMKEINPQGLVRAIQEVSAGRSILDAEATGRVLRMLRGGDTNTEPTGDLSILSHQERRVVAFVAEGLTNKEIGERLTLAENTVKNYLVNVFEKLKVKRRAQVAAMWVQQGPPSKP
ncbi:MAG: response regulator transcription factor [Opitutaceae bacterium]|nr:response regulator transcription factor [Opitutaceae bacterium]